MKNSLIINIKGLVQGVGFRPFVYRLAVKHNLSGWVKNSSSGVEIAVEGNSEKIKIFIKSLTNDAPVNSIIEEIIKFKTVIYNYREFKIIKSEDNNDEITNISPDIAVCNDCLNDMKKQENRINYPFINCTACGPRYSIIKGIPYDRNKTSMDTFTMCETCAEEYNSITDRRFHAEPVACKICGPHYTLKSKNYEIIKIDEIIDTTSKLIDDGGIIAIKSLGGFNLVCDAFNDVTVKKLRLIKKRDNKPFAVMFKNYKTAKKYAHINKHEKKLLLSWHKPVVILKTKRVISKNINIGLDTVGVILPYMPLYYLLFKKLKTYAVIFTSGNLSETPILINNKEATEQLFDICDALLLYNRDIINRVDDSVARVINSETRIIRRSRGYAPLPINLKINVDGILSCGGELKNTICFGKDNRAFLSQHIGDLKNIETYDYFKETINNLKSLLRVTPLLIACDLHPDYLSTDYALQSGIKIIQIQHHHAHIASCMAENCLDEKVIGVSFDGTGYGDDSAIWGGEFFICDLTEYKRVYHLDYMTLAGGDAAIKEPWRMAVSCLFDIYKDDFINLIIPFISGLDKNKTGLLVTAIKRNINCFKTSSVGRLFDAVSALLCISFYNTFEAEAAIRLESIINKKIKSYYEFNIDENDLIKGIIKNIVADIQNGYDAGTISAKFHNTIVLLIQRVCLRLRNQFDIDKVVLSGGFFQNKFILENTENTLIKNNFKVYSNKLVPVNDGGLSLGQLVIAAKRRESGCV